MSARGRPLIIVDVDEVLALFVRGFERFLGRQGLEMRLTRFALFQNIYRPGAEGHLEVAEGLALFNAFFATDGGDIDPAPGARATLAGLARRAEIVILTNAPAHGEGARAAWLTTHGFPYRLVVNSGLKGPAIRVLAERAAGAVAFVDDLLPNLDSAAECAPAVHRFQMVADERLRPLAPADAERHRRIDDWPTLGDALASALKIQAPATTRRGGLIATADNRRKRPAMLAPAADLAATRRAAFPGESADYAAARQALLTEEIELRRHLTRVADQRRALPPGPVIAKDYRFIDANGANVGLIELFGDRDTLVTYFWMYGPGRERPCPMCTNLLGPLDGNAADIKQRVALKVIGRSPVARQIAFAQERGWRRLDFVQTVGDDYPRDLGALTAEGEEYPALVVYRRDGERVRLFWAGEMGGAMADPGQDPRGAPDLAPLWTILDLTPAGRDPHWYPKLSY